MNSFYPTNAHNYLELDESPIDFVTSCNPFPVLNQASSVSPSSYSSSSSPVSNWTADHDDSGLDATNMSYQTSFSYSNSNVHSGDGSGSGVSLPPSFAGSACFSLQHQQQQPQHQQQQHVTNAQQQPVHQLPLTAVHQRPTFQRSHSLFSDCSSLSNSVLSDSSAGFRSHSSSFGSGQRPTLGRAALTGSDAFATQTAALIADETETTLFEFPVPNPVQVAQVSSRTGGSSDQLAQQVELRMLSQPARNHRARYRTEGSRGAIKDRMGRSFPVVKLYGYNLAPVKVRCFIGHDKKPGEAHLYYQVSRIIGKNITPCAISKVDGIKMIEFELSPETDMQTLVNCIGIVKERHVLPSPVPSLDPGTDLSLVSSLTLSLILSLLSAAQQEL